MDNEPDEELRRIIQTKLPDTQFNLEMETIAEWVQTRLKEKPTKELVPFVHLLALDKKTPDGPLTRNMFLIPSIPSTPEERERMFEDFGKQAFLQGLGIPAAVILASECWTLDEIKGGPPLKGLPSLRSDRKEILGIFGTRSDLVSCSKEIDLIRSQDQTIIPGNVKTKAPDSSKREGITDKLSIAFFRGYAGAKKERDLQVIPKGNMQGFYSSDVTWKEEQTNQPKEEFYRYLTNLVPDQMISDCLNVIVDDLKTKIAKEKPRSISSSTTEIYITLSEPSKIKNAVFEIPSQIEAANSAMEFMYSAGRESIEKLSGSPLMIITEELTMGVISRNPLSKYDEPIDPFTDVRGEEVIIVAISSLDGRRAGVVMQTDRTPENEILITHVDKFSCEDLDNPFYDVDSGVSVMHDAFFTGAMEELKEHFQNTNSNTGKKGISLDDIQKGLD